MTTDKERLDFLQELTEGYGLGWVLRRSLTGRGWRLHESSRLAALPDVREAIDQKIEFNKRIEEDDKINV